MAQVGVETDPGSSPIFLSKNTGFSSLDGIGIKGEFKPQPFYGIGVYGEGGWKGVAGYATVSGTGTRVGGFFEGSGGTGTNYGVLSSATGCAFSYAGYFNGAVHVQGAFTQVSDERLKREVRPLSGSLDKVMGLRPASYYFDNTVLPVEGLAKGRQIGLMAGDVAHLLPELVHEIPIPKREDQEKKLGEPDETFQSVNYIGLIPVLVGAIKEQQAEINALKAALGK